MFVATLFAVFLWRGTRTAIRTHNLFGRFLAVGITSMSSCKPSSTSAWCSA